MLTDSFLAAVSAPRRIALENGLVVFLVNTAIDSALALWGSAVVIASAIRTGIARFMVFAPLGKVGQHINWADPWGGAAHSVASSARMRPGRSRPKRDQNREERHGGAKDRSPHCGHARWRRGAGDRGAGRRSPARRGCAARPMGHRHNG